jgi:hypothetical protein
MTTTSGTSSTTSTTNTGRRLVQVACDTWEPTLLVWTQIDGATWTSELGTISTTADADWFSGVVHGGDLEPVRCWSFARTERALIEKSDLFATRTIAAGDIQCGDVITVNHDRFTSRKTVFTIEYESAFGDDLIAVTFTDGLERLYKQSTSVDVHNWPVEAGRTLTETPEPEAEPVITITVTEQQQSKINQALHTHIDAAVKAVRKARKAKNWGDGLNERLAFADLTVAIATLRAIDPSVGDHFTAEWLIGGAR